HIRLPAAYVQPIASDDVARAMADATLAAPVNGTIEIAGPEKVRMAALVERYLANTGDARSVIADQQARYFGALLEDDTLVPVRNPHLGAINFDTWFRRSRATL